jgi:hypothetical protein
MLFRSASARYGGGRAGFNRLTRAARAVAAAALLLPLSARGEDVSFFPSPLRGHPARRIALEGLNGLRMDPGYFYDMPESRVLSVKELARLAVSEARAGGFNTIFLYAYNSYYGAFYPTNYPLTAVEPSLGKANVFRLVSREAIRQGLRVVAVLPVNDFRHAWEKESGWRVKKTSAQDYKPGQARYLSPAHPGFRAWYEGFLQDFLAKNPEVHGIEAVEPGFDLQWAGAVDQNEAALGEFRRLYPGQAAKGAAWKRFRAAKLNEHLALFSRVAHAAGKESHVVQTWTARADGSLMTAPEIRDGLGFDWEALLELPRAERPDWINGEFIFQEGRATHGAAFTPEWAQGAAREFTRFVNGRARAIIHAEHSEFSGPHGTFSASLGDVEVSLRSALTVAQGRDLYDYQQWRILKGFGGRR